MLSLEAHFSGQWLGVRGTKSLVGRCCCWVSVGGYGSAVAGNGRCLVVVGDPKGGQGRPQRSVLAHKVSIAQSNLCCLQPSEQLQITCYIHKARWPSGHLGHVHWRTDA